MLEEKNIIIDSLRITYYQKGDLGQKNTLLFLHGWGSQALHFRKTLERCENTVAVDLPGFGKSDVPHTAWALSEYAQFLKVFLEKLHIQNPLIAGHSFGGSVAIKYTALGNPAQKLILIGSAGIRKPSPKKYGLFILAKMFGLLFSLPGIRGLKKSVRGWFYKKIDSEDYLHAGKLTETYKKIISEDLTEDLKKIHVPTTLIWGEEDTETPLADGKLMQKLIDGSQLCIIPGAGHYVFLDNEQEFGKIFLSQLS